MLTSYRLCQKIREHDAFSGEGPKRIGMRWNYKDVPVVYLAEHLSLAALEIMVNFSRKAIGVPFVFLKAEMPDNVKTETVKHLPRDWRSFPFSTSTQDIGTEWALSKRTAVLIVPSTVIPHERNYIFNPLHPDFKKIVISDPKDFSFDSRLF